MIEGQFGRADLLRVRAEIDEECLEKTALLAGYNQKVKSNSVENTTQPKKEVQAEKAQLCATTQWASVPFWRVVTQKSFNRPPNPQPKHEDNSSITSVWSKPPVPHTPVIKISQREVGLVLDALTIQVESKSLDIPVLTDRLARAEPALPIPLQKKRSRPRITLLIDRSRRLVPFWAWQDQWAEQLIAASEFVGVDVAVCEELSLPQSLSGKPKAGWWSLDEAQAVLLLGDAGYTGGRQYSAWWRHVGGYVLPPECSGLLLSPIAIPPSTHTGWSPLPLRSAGGPIDGEYAESLELLFTLASVAVRLEPGMVSELRELIAAPVAIDALFWQHPNLQSQSSVAATLHTEAQQEYRNRFRRLCDESKNHSMLKSALAVIRKWRAELPQEIWFEEVLSLPKLAHSMLDEPQDLTDARDFVTELARKGAGNPGAIAHNWLKRVFDRDPDITAQPDSVQVAFSRLWRAVNPHSKLRPSGYQPVGGSQQQETQWLLSINGTADGLLQINEQPVAEPNIHTAGSCIGQIRKRGAETVLQCDSQRMQMLYGTLTVADTARKVLIRTDCEEITLASTTKPDWASAIGRDHYGLWVEIQIEKESSPNIETHQPPRPVVQRLRWIPPGEFWMGSPEDEPGRWDDEGPRQRVRLTDGYWMFDTPVTQELWQSVMRDNPSSFVSETRPVEQVSFEDAGKFLQRINARCPDLKLSLPTEAQWEYACRAGSDQATYAGPMQIDGERHASVHSDIAWYGGNSSDGFELVNGYDSSDWDEQEIPGDMSGTHPVAKKKPNQWGLYDMLGNVLEWCDSGWGDYSGGFIENPTGYEASARVVRGGSWVNHARFVRAAFRVEDEPVNRYDFLGFRCLRV